MRVAPVFGISFSGPGVRSTYLEALLSSTGSFIPLKGGLNEEFLERCWGFVLTGSIADVNPALYGDDLRHDTCVDTDRDATDYAVLSHADRTGKPVLGICKGLQIMNVFRGGSLAQHFSDVIQTPIEHFQCGDRERDPIHTVRLQVDSHLFNLAEEEEVWVNSSHRQVVDRLGQGLRISAISEDGLIEGIEDVLEPDRFFGVQWHPERFDDPLSTAIFKRFIKACSEWSARECLVDA